MLVGIAVFATLFTLMPALGGNNMKTRMKSVALERDELRAKQRARLAAEADRRRKGLREQQSTGMRNVVDRLDLRRALADEATLNKLKMAGFRGQNPLTRFLFFRLVLPFVFFAAALVYLFLLGGLPEQPPFVKLFVSIVAAYAGFYAPVLYVSNRASKRKQSINMAWPDALDLLLICVESGMSVEAAFRRVAEEIGAQSVELAEEFVLTNAELSFLQERRQAYENLAGRTGLDSVRSVSQALIQAERYGTPIAHALRVLSQESRDARMNAAEKKAAALPPKLTVPMILFFLPVLFAVILGPAGIQVSERGIFGGP
jgi:tight adherence protein C